MTREQTTALALLIQRGAGNALDIPHEGNTPQGLAQAALMYARACEWLDADEGARLRRVEREHAKCRLELGRARARVDALEVALAGVLGAARMEPPHLDNLIAAITHAGDVLGHEP